jgi:hypothetical protein
MVLNLKNNKIGDEGARVIGEALKVNPTLTKLQLYNNFIRIYKKGRVYK